MATRVCLGKACRAVIQHPWPVRHRKSNSSSPALLPTCTAPAAVLPLPDGSKAGCTQAGLRSASARTASAQWLSWSRAWAVKRRVALESVEIFSGGVHLHITKCRCSTGLRHRRIVANPGLVMPCAFIDIYGSQLVPGAVWNGGSRFGIYRNCLCNGQPPWPDGDAETKICKHSTRAVAIQQPGSHIDQTCSWSRSTRPGRAVVLHLSESASVQAQCCSTIAAKDVNS